MSTIIIGWINRIDAAATQITAGSQLIDAPASAVANPHVVRRWHTASGVNASWLLIDLGTPLACDVLVVLGGNLTDAATVRLRASDLDPAALTDLLLDTGAIAAGVKTGYGAIHKAFASTAARYWRIDLSDSTLDHLRVGRVYLGPTWRPSSNLLYGWSITPQDPSRLARSAGGQAWADELPQRRLLQFTLSFMTEDEMYGAAFALARATGVTRDVLAIRDLDSAFVAEQSVYGLMQAAQPIVHEQFGIFTQRFSIEERL